MTNSFFQSYKFNFVKKWFKEDKYEIGFILREFFPGTTMVNDTKACLKSILLTISFFRVNDACI